MLPYVGMVNLGIVAAPERDLMDFADQAVDEAAKRSAGFPSPAADYIEQKLDLNHLLIKHREATFFLRVQGDSMIGAGVHTGDLLVVDRSLTAQHKKVIVAVIDGELVVRRLYKADNKIVLQAENTDYPEIEFEEGNDLEVWGVVTSVIHEL